MNFDGCALRAAGVRRNALVLDQGGTCEVTNIRSRGGYSEARSALSFSPSSAARDSARNIQRKANSHLASPTSIVKCMVMTVPPDTVTQLLVRRMAALYHRLNHEIGVRPLVLPDSSFFPDVFSGDEKSARRVVRRMMSHAGMDDVPVKVRVPDAHDAEAAESSAQCCGGGCQLTPSDKQAPLHDATANAEKSDSHTGNCGTGGCGSCATTVDSPMVSPRVVDLGSEWLIQIPASELGHDVALTTNIAKALGAIFLLDTCPQGKTLEHPLEVEAEIAGTALGFGALLLEGSYLFSKSCGGPKIARLTTLSCSELAILAALFVARGNHRAGALKRHLSTTQASAYREAEALVKANRSIADKLRSNPAQLALGDFSLGPVTGLWHRLFGGAPANVPRSVASSDFDIAELEAAILSTDLGSAKREKRRAPDVARDELRALVDDALAQSARQA